MSRHRSGIRMSLEDGSSCSKAAVWLARSCQSQSQDLFHQGLHQGAHRQCLAKQHFDGQLPTPTALPWFLAGDSTHFSIDLLWKLSMSQCLTPGLMISSDFGRTGLLWTCMELVKFRMLDHQWELRRRMGTLLLQKGESQSSSWTSRIRQVQCTRPELDC